MCERSIVQFHAQQSETSNVSCHIKCVARNCRTCSVFRYGSSVRLICRHFDSEVWAAIDFLNCDTRSNFASISWICNTMHSQLNVTWNYNETSRYIYLKCQALKCKSACNFSWLCVLMNISVVWLIRWCFPNLRVQSKSRWNFKYDEMFFNETLIEIQVCATLVGLCYRF